MTDADLIAAFLAKNNVTKIESGVRSTTDREIYKNMGYERNTIKVFFVRAYDELGHPFTARINADSLADAESVFTRKHPEATIYDVSRHNPNDSTERLEDVR